MASEFMMDWYAFIFNLCGYLCHQMPSRSFFIAGYQFPLCYRCTGLFLGTIAFLVMVYWRRSPRLRVAILLIIPMIVDLGLQYGGWWEGANGVRLVTGLGLGMGMPTTIIRIMWVKSDKLIWLINSFTKGLH